MEEMSHVFSFAYFFLLPLITFSCFSFKETRLLYILSLASAVSLLSTSVKTLKFSRKKGDGFVVIFFSSRMGGHACNLPPKHAGVRNVKFYLCLHEGVDERTDVPTHARFCQNQNFLES